MTQQEKDALEYRCVSGRAKLFKAFDIYKSNVNYGLVLESNDRHEAIAKWYQDILNITETLDESLITNYPEEIEKYL